MRVFQLVVCLSILCVIHAVEKTVEMEAGGNDTKTEEVPKDLAKEDVIPAIPAEIPAAIPAGVPVKEEKEKKTMEDFEAMDLEELKKHLGEHGEELGTFKDSFDPYENHETGEEEEPELGEYDFDPSEGLSYLVHEGTIECVYEEIKDKEDHVAGAYIVSASEPKIDFTIKDPKGMIVLRRYGEVEDEYEITDTEPGVYELCFSNINYSGNKMITHVTHKMRSQHPVEKEHVSHLSQFARHLDVKLGEFESEQRLLQIRTDRHMKTEESTNERVAYYSTFELFTYILISILQVVYIKHLLDIPTRGTRSWA